MGWRSIIASGCMLLSFAAMPTVAAAQCAGLRSGANEAITLGCLEGSVHHFHETIERALE